MKRNKKFYREKELRRKAQKRDSLRGTTYSSWNARRGHTETVPLKHKRLKGYVLRLYPRYRRKVTKEEKRDTRTLVDIFQVEVRASKREEILGPAEVRNFLMEQTVKESRLQKYPKDIQDMFKVYVNWDFWGEPIDKKEGKKREKEFILKEVYRERYSKLMEFRIVKEYITEVPAIYPEEISEYDKLSEWLDHDGRWNKYARLSGVSSRYNDWYWNQEKSVRSEKIEKDELKRDISERKDPPPKDIEEKPYWVLAREEYEN